MKRYLLMAVFCGLMFPTTSFAAKCSYAKYVLGPCTCPQGLYSSSIKGTFPLSKAAIRNKLRRNARRFCRTAKGMLKGWNDRVGQWRTYKKNGRRYGTMILRYQCRWHHKRRKRAISGVWKRYGNKFVRYKKVYARKDGKNFTTKQLNAWSLKVRQLAKHAAPKQWLQHLKNKYGGSAHIQKPYKIKYVSTKRRVHKKGKVVSASYEVYHQIFSRYRFSGRRKGYRCFR